MPEDIVSEGFKTQPSSRSPEPDAHGQAALLLLESIIYTLIDANLLTTVQAIEAVRTASELKVEVADAIGEADSRMRQSLTLLSKIERGLALDERRQPAND